MKELFMQIEINDTKLNSIICFDNIINLNVLKNRLLIKDINDWSTSIEINEDIEIKVNFYNLDEEFEF